MISPLLGSFRWGQQQSRELSRLPECEDVQQEHSHNPVVGDLIYHKGLPWVRVVKVNSDGSCECLNPYLNELLSIPRAEVLEGLCENERREDENLRLSRQIFPAWAFVEEAARAGHSGWSASVGPVIPWLRAGVAGHIGIQAV